ncbi:unnamed protein product [Rhizophagus irregularis]|uniref:Uncharacterized protein n=1 Tax=Rhizophagus irregularis TaxID=588596 RepID=A0A915Z428_9GLOM|nr:hypothetical protein RIR_jg19803.t1 [Rhizophagus irregularis DAOM 181602=DAOM 197198]CAB4467775.1 unnamed protein product [Rhizophagus irregularis]CAB5181678.1 unnamed protein product [Rhizophagus irregularis]CAB5360412.1 unnamed protein product [Rhizophagus irregularis]
MNIQLNNNNFNSPPLFIHFFRIATLNIQDINYTLKQKQVIEMLKLNHISILGLSKTKINKSQSKVVYNYLPNYTTYFDNDSAFPIGLGVEC